MGGGLKSCDTLASRTKLFPVVGVLSSMVHLCQSVGAGRAVITNQQLHLFSHDGFTFSKKLVLVDLE
jgi:hypothetical protein